VKPENALNKTDWHVTDVGLSVCQEFVERFHYSRGGANTAVFRHGLFRANDYRCFGIAWWIPPTKAAAVANYDGNWRKVLMLHRLVCVPEAPKNAASFLIMQSVARIKQSGLWECLLTYADEGQGHTGAIYRATNWEYLGKTAPEPTFTDVGGRMVSRKAGPHTRTRKEMADLGMTVTGTFSRHRFRMVLKLTHIKRLSQKEMIW
jgi:hypothetical protein